jgi:hypothetical protein
MMFGQEVNIPLTLLAECVPGDHPSPIQYVGKLQEDLESMHTQWFEITWARGRHVRKLLMIRKLRVVAMRRGTQSGCLLLDVR